MFYEDLTEAQRAELGAFERRLHDAGWDIEPVATLLHTGTWTNPQGSAELSRPSKQLSADFYLEDRTLQLVIEDATRRLRFRVVCGDSIESVLNWLTDSQEKLDTLNFAEYLRALIPVCSEVVFVRSDGKRYRLALDDLETGRFRADPA
jgi:hypothetical protein